MSLDNESIIKMLDDYEKDSKALKKTLIQMCWYMRGGITLDEAFIMGHQEREIIASLIKDNLDITKDTGMPFF